MANYNPDRTYDQFLSSRAVIGLPACSFAGTQTAAAAGGLSAKVPFACKLHAATRLPVSGATVAAAGYTAGLVIYKSLAGTGTLTAVGTFAPTSGTEAGGAYNLTGGTASFSATESTVSLAKDDTITVQCGIATVAVIGTNNYWFAVQELPS